MSKYFYHFLFSISLISILTGCQISDNICTEPLDDVFLKNAVVPESGTEPVVTDLLADKVLDIGDVTIGTDGINLVVKFSTIEPWYMTNTKVWVGTDPAELPLNNGGNLIRGKLQVNEDQPDANEVAFTFLLSEIGGDGVEQGDEIIIVTYADVEMIVEGVDGIPVIRKEGAFGWGENEISTKAWGWYYTYTLQLDRDGDGVPDYLDECPDEPGDPKLEGCPDRDGDGIPDKDDDCPDQAGFDKFNGCPDSDEDGVPDNRDKCPDTPKGCLVDTDGCPLDSDGDGVIDCEDKCPTEKGPASNQGCPDWD